MSDDEEYAETVSERELERELEVQGRWGVTVIAAPEPELVGRALELGPRPLVIGRAPEGAATLKLRDRLLSRSHVALSQRGRLQIFEVEDLGSKNGTYVGGARVSSGGRTHVTGSALVRIGATFLELGPIPDPRQPFPEATASDVIVGRSMALRRLLVEVERVAGADVPVLLIGETGTGKELVAARVHALSGRTGPFVALNCAAITESLAESELFGVEKNAVTGVDGRKGQLAQAHRGTLFLDEVGELPLGLQPKLLRAVELKEFTTIGGRAQRVDVRIVSATNVELGEAVDSGAFRADLLARLGYTLRLPPLRERRQDIPLLAAHFLAEIAPGRRFSWSPAALEALLTYAWPMNIRELRTTLQHVALRADPEASEVTIRQVDLPPHLKTAPAETPEVPESSEHVPFDTGETPRPGPPTRDDLVRLMVHYEGNVARVADYFGKERRQVYRWLKRHDIDPDSYRTG